jgi:hypothetical protein
VEKMQKETTKIRPVFDCAAKRGGVCLNDFLTQGPQVMNKLGGADSDKSECDQTREMQQYGTRSNRKR